MDKKQEKTKQKFQAALTNPSNDKVAVIYSVKVSTVRLTADDRREGKKQSGK